VWTEVASPLQLNVFSVLSLKQRSQIVGQRKHAAFAVLRRARIELTSPPFRSTKPYSDLGNAKVTP
jgi:hypothetical protein